MRSAFFNALYKIATQDERVILLTSDTGAIVLDQFRENIPQRCINVGIAEANMVGVAAGLAMTGKIVYIYAIIPFVTMRCFEQIRVDVCCQNLPVKAVGIGAGMDYSTLGPTHHGFEDIALMRSLPEMTILNPADNTAASAFAQVSYEVPGPAYVRLNRSGEPLVYTDNDQRFSDGANILNTSTDLCIVATGKMVLTAQQVAKGLSKRSIDAGVVDLYRVKPLNAELLLKAIGDAKYVATLEEHSVIGGIGSAVSTLLAERGLACQVKRLGLPDKFCRQYGTREYLQSLIRLDVEGVTDTLSEWVVKRRG